MRNCPPFAICLAAWLLALTNATAPAAELNICADESAPPCTFVNDRGDADGSCTRLIRTALDRVGHVVRIDPMPWERCLLEAKNGSVDAVAVSSYVPAREEFLLFPDGAADADHAPGAVAVLESVVVTPASAGYEFDGRPELLPAPVRVPRGWVIGRLLSQGGVQVEASSPTDKSNLIKLSRDGDGSAVVLRESADLLLGRPEFAGKLKVSALPLGRVPYFLAFSRKSKLDHDSIRAIWAELARLRSTGAPARGHDASPHPRESGDPETLID